MPHIPDSASVIAIAAGAFCTGIALMWLVTATIRLRAQLQRKKRFKRGAEGEAEALLYLQRHGFTICKAQEEQAASIQVNGVSHDYTVRADYRAVKKGKHCIVEVKTGKKAVDPLFSDTRRQLLEYAVVYNVDTVFLFDADEGELLEIDFPGVVKQNKRFPAWRVFLCGVVVGGGLVVLAQWFGSQ